MMDSNSMHITIAPLAIEFYCVIFDLEDQPCTVINTTGSRLFITDMKTIHFMPYRLHSFPRYVLREIIQDIMKDNTHVSLSAISNNSEGPK